MVIDHGDGYIKKDGTEDGINIILNVVGDIIGDGK